MKNTLTRFSLFLPAAFCMAIMVSGQTALPTSIDIGLYPYGTDSLEVRVTPNDSTFDELVSNLSFTIRWTAGTGITDLGQVDQTIDGDLCPLITAQVAVNPAGVQTSGGFNYLNYNIFSFTQLASCPTQPGYNWPADTESVIARIPYNTPTGCTEFNIVSDAFTTGVNYDYFCSLNGNDRTGVIISPDIQVGCAVDCLGVPGGTATVGSSCDDGDPNTGNDVYQSDCTCAGEPIDCLGVPGGTATIGSSCDDGDPNTGNDVYQADCTCAGELIDCLGVPGGTATIGSSCDDGDPNTGNDVYQADCTCAGELIDCLGVPGGTATVGSSCDDGDPNTGNDVYQSDCTCAGELIDCLGVPGGTATIGSSCDDGDPNTGNDVYQSDCTCAGEPIDCLGVPGGTATIGSSCDDGDPNTGNDVYQADCTCAGELIDCLGVPGGTATIGSSCDDGDPNTGNDVYQADCTCAGELIDCLGVPGGTATIGSSCDDGDPNTGNDVYQADCTCAGELIDCLGVPGGTALPGTSCDDGDPNTGNDMWDANCVCMGDTSTGIDTSESTSFRVFPNPASDLIYVQLDGSARMEVVFYDALGKVVKTSGLNGASGALSIAELSNGLYHMVVSDQKGTQREILKIQILH